MQNEDAISNSIRDVFDAVDKNQDDEVDGLIAKMLSTIASSEDFGDNINMIEAVNKYVREVGDEIKRSSISGESFEKSKNAITEYIARISAEPVVDGEGKVICK